MRAAEKFADVAVKITGVSTIEEALKTTVHSASRKAKKLGIAKGQPVRLALKIISQQVNPSPHRRGEDALSALHQPIRPARAHLAHL